MRTFYLYSPLALQTFIWPITRPLFRFFLRLEINGIERLKELKQSLWANACPNALVARSRGIIFAVNHSSELDPILVPASLPFLSPLMPMFYTSREQEFYKTCGWRQIFYGGWFFKLWGAHPVRAGRQNYEESLSTHIEVLSRGKSICIFPEGRTTQDGTIGKEAHGGVAYLAWRTGAPVVPVRIKGVFKLTLCEFLVRKRAVEVVFGKPFFPVDLFPYTNHLRSQHICVERSPRDISPSPSPSPSPLFSPPLAEIKTAANRVLDTIRQL